MKRRDLVALFCCALLSAGVETYWAAPAIAKDGDQGGSGNSDGGRGNSDGGNSDGGRGNSDGGRGNSGGAGGGSDGGRGNSGGAGGGSDGGRGNSGGAGGGSDGGRGNSGGGRGAADPGGGAGPDSGARSGTSDAGRGAADPGGRAGADSGARSGNSQGGARGRTGNDAFGSKGWGTTSPERAREAVSHGWALPLSTVLPTVSTAVPGQVLEVDLRQTWTGEWHYDFLVLTMDRRYREVVVDARRNQVLQVRRR